MYGYDPILFQVSLCVHSLAAFVCMQPFVLHLDGAEESFHFSVGVKTNSHPSSCQLSVELIVEVLTLIFETHTTYFQHKK